MIVESTNCLLHPDNEWCKTESRSIRITVTSPCFPLKSEASAVAEAVGVGIGVGDDRSGVGVGVGVWVNDGEVYFGLGLPYAEGAGVAVGVRVNEAMADRVRADVIVQDDWLVDGFGKRISEPLVDDESVKVLCLCGAVVSVVATRAVVEGGDRFGVALQVLHRKSGSNGRQEQNRLFGK